MIGSALGISPREVNDNWLLPERFQVGITGTHNGKTSDLWQIRKYETKQIKAFRDGKEPSPYKTAVIVRELLYASSFVIYLAFPEASDYDVVASALRNPAWALSLGREDELIQIEAIERTTLNEQEGLHYVNTVLPYDIYKAGYKLNMDAMVVGRNILAEAPSVVTLPTCFRQEADADVREGNNFQPFTFVSSISVTPTDATGYHDPDEDASFQIF